ncbi:MAG TPA: hypothetical protein VF399_10590 [bacterium]
MDDHNRYRSIYGSVRSRLPSSLRMLLSRAVYRLRRRPVYHVNAAKNGIRDLELGTVIFTADFELAWAWRFDRDPKHKMIDLCSAERENISLILEKLETLRIPMTWAIVGHLFLDHCEKVNNKAHREMPRPNFFKNNLWSFMSGDWYDGDPCSDAAHGPEWYAPDLIKSIINTRVKHEIACHSFSHIGFKENYCPAELARAELKQCADIMAGWGLKPVTMVFPGDEAGHFSLLTEYGYKCMRYFPDDDAEISMPFRTNHGLWAFPVASNIVPDDEWNSRYILWRLKKCVDKAIKKKALCHFWFHPSISQERIDEVLFPVMDYCAQKRKENKLKIKTMAGVMDSLEKQCAG